MLSKTKNRTPLDQFTGLLYDMGWLILIAVLVASVVGFTLPQFLMQIAIMSGVFLVGTALVVISILLRPIPEQNKKYKNKIGRQSHPHR